MLRTRLLLGCFTLAIGLNLGSTMVVAAVPATPESIPCTVAPISIGDLQVLVLTGTPTTASPVAAATIDAEVVNAVTMTIEQSIACTNANQPLRALTLFTDNYLIARFTGAGADDLGHLTAAVTRRPAPAETADQLRLVSIGALEPFGDGRVSVVVVTANAAESFTDTLTFAKNGATWLIDETHTVTPVQATPTA